MPPVNRLKPITLSLLAAMAVHAGDYSTGVETVHSQTGQFVVSGRLLAPSAARTLSFDPNFNRWMPAGWTSGAKPNERSQREPEELGLRLDPHYLVATAERIRQLLHDELKLEGRHRGTVFIKLLEAARQDDQIVVASGYDQLRREWNFKIEMPSEVAATKLVRLLTEVLILEAATRGAGGTQPEIPLWLREGMVGHVTALASGRAFFEPDHGLAVTARPEDEAVALRNRIGKNEVFTLEQLSWPLTLPARPELEQDFRNSAHALVNELIRIPGGGRALGGMLLNLSQFQNWQFAFLGSFQDKFPTLLAAEKWWAVTSLHLGGRSDFERWTVAESLARLTRQLKVPIERRPAGTGEILREEMALPDIVSSMNYSVHKPILERVIAGLFNLELRAAPHLTRLVGDYRGALEKYLADRDEAFRVETERRQRTRRHEVAVEGFVRQLARLDTLRSDFELLIPEPAPEPGTLTAVAP